MTHTVDRQSIDTETMRCALRAALAGPAADPNPRVGAVVLDREGSPVGVGHHAGAGTPHAEILALRRAGERAVGGTLYVTLEPCSHTGRTPPCVDAVLQSGVARVVYGTPDPNPRAAGGAAVLTAHGVQVEGGPVAVGDELAGSTQELVRAWSFAMEHGRPLVVWKSASTLDGRVAARDGSSAWITSAAARADAHELRGRSGAVVVGVGTALLDDPALTARRTDGSLQERQPLRVVVGHRPLPSGARLADGSAPTLRLHTHDPGEVLAELHRREVRQVLLEGGPTLAAAFWRAGLVDEVVSYLAPALLGAGATVVDDLGITAIDGIARLEVTGLDRVGPDIRITSRPVTAGEKR
jgi:diaminohydroxyphosphoribosylaminopyrimidine deaminase/5-amino-6-(5-phosphoribosylamino)uracil reductase